MASSKTKVYFWLKIDENFYKNLAIKKARKLPGGDTMIVIYQRMMLLSLSTNGVLYYEGEMQSLDEELALNLDESVENISMTLSYFKASGLIQIDEEENAEMLQVPALLAQETNWAKYQRDRRNEKKEQAKLETVQPKLDNVQPVSNQCPTDIDIEIELDKELEQETKPDDDDLINKLSELLRNKPLSITVEGMGVIGGKLKGLKQQSNADVVPMFEYYLDYALAFGKNNPVKYSLVSLNNSVTEGCVTVEDLQQKESVLNAPRTIEEMGNIPVDIDIQNTDWTKY